MAPKTWATIGLSFSEYLRIGKIDSAKEIISDYAISESSSVFEIKNNIWDKPQLKEELIKNYAFQEFSRDSLKSYVIGNIDQILYEKLQLNYSLSFFYGNLTFEKYEKLKSDSRVATIERKINKDAEDGIFPDF